MKRINWIVTDNIASAVSLADMYRLGTPVDSELIFPRIKGNLRNDTGLLECVAHTAVITLLAPMNELGLHISVEGYQRTLYAMAEWHTGDRGFARKAENVIVILNGVATYLKRPYTQPKREPVPNYRLETATPLVFQAELGNRLKARQPVLEMLVHPVTSPRVLRG